MCLEGPRLDWEQNSPGFGLLMSLETMHPGGNKSKCKHSKRQSQKGKCWGESYTGGSLRHWWSQKSSNASNAIAEADQLLVICEINVKHLLCGKRSSCFTPSKYRRSVSYPPQNQSPENHVRVFRDMSGSPHDDTCIQHVSCHRKLSCLNPD